MSDKREKENLTLLGNQNTQYKSEYDPSVLETFLKMIILSNSTVLSLPVFVR